MDEKHEHAYGWYSDEPGTVNTTKIVGYDFNAETLYVIYKAIPLSIWRIISDYAETVKNITFELYEINCARVNTERLEVKYENGFARAQNCNWYGRYTFGTCWFRGCKVWLTPRAGYSFENVMASRGIDDMKKLLGQQLGKHKKDLKTCPERYNTNYIPLRDGSPKEIVKKITTRSSRNYFVDHDDNGDVYCRLDALSILNLYKIRGNIRDDAEIYLNEESSGRSVPDPSEGDADVVIIYELDAICKELEWVQRIGEINHSVRFEWI